MSRHENTNQFKDGLLMDLHPLQTPNTVLTDCLNGTFITYNGNEYSLQNDMGNFKLKNCRLSPGYLPIGSASYADTIYMLAYNPIKDRVEIGSYPAPVQYSGDSYDYTKSLKGVIENWLTNAVNNDDGFDSDAESHILYQTDLYSYEQEVVFDKKEQTLKKGDEYLLTHNDFSKWGFEEVEYSVIFENGKNQKFTPTVKLDGNLVSVPWDSPGNIRIKSKMFGLEQSSHRVTSVANRKESSDICILYEMFITNPSFIKVIDDNKNKILCSKSQQHISIKGSIDGKTIDDPDSNFDYKIDTVKIENWLGIYRKISFILKFTIPTTTDQTYKQISLEPYLRAPFLLKGYKMENGEEKWDSTATYDIYVYLDEHCVNLDVSSVISSGTEDTIGNTIFYWDEDRLYVDYEHFDDMVPYYAYIKVDPESDKVNLKKLIREEITDTNESGELTIELESLNLEKNKFYLWFFGKRRKYSDIDKICITIEEFATRPGMEKTTVQPEETLSDDDSYISYTTDNNTYYLMYNGKYITEKNIEEKTNYKFIDNTVYENKYSIVDDTSKTYVNLDEDIPNVSSNIMFYYDHTEMDKLWTEEQISKIKSGNSSNIIKRYDLIPFTNVFVNYVKQNKLEIECSAISKHNYKSFDLLRIENGQILNNDPYYKYFHRFVDNEDPEKGIFYPSIVPYDFFDGEVETTPIFYVPKKLDLDVTVKNHLKINPLLDCDIEERVVYDNTVGKEYKQLSDNKGYTFADVDVYNKAQGSVQQVGDTFYFSDNVRYYQLKTQSVGDDVSRQFFAITRDGKGNKNNDFKSTWYIPNANHFTSGSAILPAMNLEWRSLNDNNYRAIRLCCPKYNNDHFGCRQIDFFTGEKTIPDLCQYISNVHETIRSEMDKNWNKPKLINNSGDSEKGKCTVEGVQSYWLYLHARTFYRDKAQRPTFTNDNFNVNIVPEWNTWDKDATGSGHDKGCSAEAYFMTFPLYNKDFPKSFKIRNKANDDPNAFVTLKSVLNGSYDTEWWWKVSGSEQHNEPHIDGFKATTDAIGLVCQKQTDEFGAGWYVAWVPNWDSDDTINPYYDLCTQTSCEIKDWIVGKGEELAKCYIETIVPEGIKEYKKHIITMYDEVDNTLPIIQTDIQNVIQNGCKIINDGLYTSEHLENFKDGIVACCENDIKNLKKHPVFKNFIGAASSASDRIKNYPIAGIYPNVEETSGASDVFESSAESFKIWKNFYVDGDGRPFIIQPDPKNHIWIRKNSKKKVFGYFPFIPGGE